MWTRLQEGHRHHHQHVGSLFLFSVAKINKSSLELIKTVPAFLILLQEGLAATLGLRL